MNELMNFNIAVVNTVHGAQNAFLYQTFDLSIGAPAFSRKAKVYKVAGKSYAVRFHETSVGDLSLSDDGEVRLSPAAGTNDTNTLDGAILIYDVTKPESLTPLAKILGKHMIRTTSTP